MDKKGLSTIVTTVLILLLSIAAVILLWTFIRPLITNAGQQATADCVTQQVSIVSATCNSTTKNVHVVVQLDAGTLTQVKVMANTAAAGTVASITSASVPGQLGTQGYDVPYTSANPETVTVGGYVGTAPNYNACTVYGPTAVTCTP